MQALVLAAGKGSRISENIEGVPKSTLEIGGQSIIRRSVGLLLERGVSVCVCTGYKPMYIQRALEGLDVQFCHNPFYGVANNIGSLWIARDCIAEDDDLIIVSADVVFDGSFLDRLIADSSDSIAATVDTSRVDSGDYFFNVDNQRRVLEYGADLEDSKRNCAYIGILRVQANAVGEFKAHLEEKMFDGFIDDYFEEVAFSFIGSDTYWPRALDMAGCPWFEIDTIEDYEHASTGFVERIDHDSE